MECVVDYYYGISRIDKCKLLGQHTGPSTERMTSDDSLRNDFSMRSLSSVDPIDDDYFELPDSLEIWDVV